MPSWKPAQVTGELKSNKSKSNTDLTLMQQANYAREVFGAQQTRRWVLCFALCQPEFRVWQFDRAGACGSTVLDINRNWKKFLATMLPFLTMDATQIGFDRRSAVKWMKASKLSTRR
jgi:hypothetical protein